MWTVFIADDEPKIRRRIKRLIGGFGEEFGVCGEAEDGVEALELIGEELPDILLVDINMPRLNGLDFIEAIRDGAENSIIIVITGHDEFDYARRAVELPIFEYVLKPVEAPTLRNIFDRASEVLRERRERNEVLRWAEREVRRDRIARIRELLDDWLHGSASPEDIDGRMRLLGLADSASLRVLALQVHVRYDGRRAEDLRERSVRTTAVRKLVEDALEGQPALFDYADRHDRLYYFSNEDWDAELGDEIRRSVQSTLNVPVRTIVADVRTDPESFVDDLEAIGGRFVSLGRHGDFLRRFFAFMEKHYSDKNLTLDAAAESLALSPGYVSRLVKQHTGYGFVEYVNRYRVFRAIELLGDGDRLMYEIADSVGYGSQHYFSRMFKRITGSSPGDYRNGGSES